MHGVGDRLAVAPVDLGMEEEVRRQALGPADQVAFALARVSGGGPPRRAQAGAGEGVCAMALTPEAASPAATARLLASFGIQMPDKSTASLFHSFGMFDS